VPPWTELTDGEATVFRFEAFDEDAPLPRLPAMAMARVFFFGPRGHAAKTIPWWLIAGMTLGFVLGFKALGRDDFASAQVLLALAALSAIALVARFVDWAMRRSYTWDVTTGRAVATETRASRPRISPAVPFTVRVTPKEFVCAGGRKRFKPIALDRIVEAVGDERLHLLLSGGTSVTLPCRLPKNEHDGLARDINRAVAEIRARDTGYRGERMHVRVAEEVRVEEVDWDEEKEANGPKDSASARRGR
jgi:hypothetical protein